MSGKKIVVASDVPLYAASIQWMLSRQEDLEVEVVAGAACEKAAEDLAATNAHAIVVECGGMLDWNGLSALCRAAAPKPVIVLTRQAPMEMVCQAREAGVRALIDLREETAAVLSAIGRALNGEMVYPESD